MFRLLLEVFAQAQFIGFGLWSIWYCVFYVSPTIQKLDSKPAIVIRYTGCITLLLKWGWQLLISILQKDIEIIISARTCYTPGLMQFGI